MKYGFFTVLILAFFLAFPSTGVVSAMVMDDGGEMVLHTQKIYIGNDSSNATTLNLLDIGDINNYNSTIRGFQQQNPLWFSGSVQCGLSIPSILSVDPFGVPGGMGLVEKSSVWAFPHRVDKDVVVDVATSSWFRLPLNALFLEELGGNINSIDVSVFRIYSRDYNISLGDAPEDTVFLPGSFGDTVYDTVFSTRVYPQDDLLGYVYQHPGYVAWDVENADGFVSIHEVTYGFTWVKTSAPLFAGGLYVFVVGLNSYVMAGAENPMEVLITSSDVHNDGSRRAHWKAEGVAQQDALVNLDTPFIYTEFGSGSINGVGMQDYTPVPLVADFPVYNANQNTYHLTLTDALFNASVNDTIMVLSDITDKEVVIDFPIFIEGVLDIVDIAPTISVLEGEFLFSINSSFVEIKTLSVDCYSHNTTNIIKAVDATNLRLTDMALNYENTTPTTTRNGIYFSNVTNSLIQMVGVNSEGNLTHGFLLENCEEVVIHVTSVRAFPYQAGIQIYAITGITILNGTQNTINTTFLWTPGAFSQGFFYHGIRLENTTHTNIMNGWFGNNERTITLNNSDYNTIKYNTIAEDHDEEGFTFYNNTYGISLDDSEHNLIYNNFFGEYVEFPIENINSAANLLNTTYAEGGGNYWHFYQSPDNFSGENQDIPGSDDIVDSPLDIEGLTDYYPLVNYTIPELVYVPLSDSFIFRDWRNRRFPELSLRRRFSFTGDYINYTFEMNFLEIFSKREGGFGNRLNILIPFFLSTNVSEIQTTITVQHDNMTTLQLDSVSKTQNHEDFLFGFNHMLLNITIPPAWYEPYHKIFIEIRDYQENIRLWTTQNPEQQLLFNKTIITIPGYNASVYTSSERLFCWMEVSDYLLSWIPVGEIVGLQYLGDLEEILQLYKIRYELLLVSLSREELYMYDYGGNIAGRLTVSADNPSTVQKLYRGIQSVANWMLDAGVLFGEFLLYVGNVLYDVVSWLGVVAIDVITQIIRAFTVFGAVMVYLMAVVSVSGVSNAVTKGIRDRKPEEHISLSSYGNVIADTFDHYMKLWLIFITYFIGVIVTFIAKLSAIPIY